MRTIRILIILALLPLVAHAAIVTRYFSTAGAGAADGTTWADRAQLISGGTWSAIITGFSFAGSDSLECRIGPGTYSAPSAALSTAASAANPLLLHGCDSSGNRLTPPDPDWVSCMPAWDDSGLPVIPTTTSIATAASATASWRLVKLTASGRNGAVVTAAVSLDWCSIVNSTANTAADGVNAVTGRIQNCLISMTGTSYNCGIAPQGAAAIYNCLITGVTGSSGDRRGIENAATTLGAIVIGCTIRGHGGSGIGSSSVNAGQFMIVEHCVIANNGGAGIDTTSTASQTAWYQFSNNMITGNGTYGIDAQSQAHVVALSNRLRDNATADFNGFGNYPVDLGNYTTDTTDALDYVDSASGDFRVKSTAAIAGMGFGVAQQPATGGGGETTTGYSK